MAKKKLTKEQLNKVMNELKDTDLKQVEKEACEHKTLRQVGARSSWYQCKKCKQLFNILNAAVYRDKAALKDEFDDVIKDAK